MTHYSTNCFSGDCGFCKECCQPMYINTNVENPPHSDEFLNRSEDLQKFYYGDRYDEIDIEYNQHLKKIIDRTDYRSPSDPGLLSKKKNLYGKKYKLIDETHSAVCDDPVCKIFFIKAHDYIRMSKFTQYPIYTREPDDKLQFCAVCIERVSDWRYDNFIQGE